MESTLANIPKLNLTVYLRYNARMTNWLKNILKNKKESRLNPASDIKSEHGSSGHGRDSDEDVKTIHRAVERTVAEYGETLKRLGDE